MWRRRSWWVLVVAAAAGGVQAQASAPLLKVVLADGRTRAFSRAELEAMPAETASARLRDGAGSASSSPSK